MYTDDMQRPVTRQCQHAVQQAAAGRFHQRYVDIVPVNKIKLAEYGIAVVALVINGVFAIGMMMPDLVGKKLELAAVRPVFVLQGMAQVLTLYFLQKQDVRIDFPQGMADFMQNETPVAGAEALVDIVGNNFQV